ncbi:MAG: CoA pyrophosphatase [Gemmatimonadota bacterium]
MSQLIEALRATLQDRPARTVHRPDGTTEAAVALLLRATPSLELLLIHRAEMAGDPWSGHIAFPGGRRESADSTLLETALRESDEELGANVSRLGRPLGALHEMAPSARRLPSIVIAPFVVAVPPDLRLRPDPREVQEAFWAPVADLRAEASATEIVHGTGPEARTFPAIRHGRHTVWGLTLGALWGLFDALDAAAGG